MLTIGALVEAEVQGTTVHARIEQILKDSCSVRLVDAPFTLVQLGPHITLKVVYGVGEFKIDGERAHNLTGTTIDLKNDLEGGVCGVIKQYDASLNCFLLRYDNGEKEWVDLTRKELKLTLRIEAEFPCSPQIPMLQQIPEPSPDTTTDSPWYFDGSQIELFDENHAFQEGAVVCNRTQSKRLCLFSTTKGMFDIDVTTYPHKVILHGLSKVQTIPSGYCIEVYNTLRGAFRSGYLLKKAQVAKLVPVRFDTASLEWTDLSCQTFKLVLFPSQPRISAREFAARSFSFPRLSIGTLVEIHDGKSYRKHSIVQMTSTRHVYQVQDSLTRVQSVFDIATTRCKLCLKNTIDFDLETSRLLDQTIEVYLKAHKRVDVGRICGGNNKTRMLQVEFEANRREWYHLSTTKMKIRFNGQSSSSLPLFTSNNTPNKVEPKLKLERAHSLQNVLASPPRPALRKTSSSTNLMLERTPLALIHRQPLQPKGMLKRADSFNTQDNNASEWKMQIDPISHQTYYVHVPTGQSHWHPPSNVDISSLEWLDDTYHINANISSIQMPVGPIEAVRHSRQLEQE